MQSQEFLDIGRHCKEPSCNQLDFLPFKCPSCHLDFCSEHWRPPKGHTCADFDEAKADNRIPTCPLCSQPVPFPPSQDPNAAMDAHLSLSCPVLHPERATKTSRSPNQCSASGCRTKMIVPIECEGCHRKFCPSHRWKSDHACSSRSSGASSSSSSSDSSQARIQDKKGFGGLFTRSSGPGGAFRAPGAAGLAALRRAQQTRIDSASTTPASGAASEKASPSAAKPGVAPRRKTTAPAPADSDSEVEIVSFKAAAGPNKTATAGKKALASVGVDSKTDKRARAEQESKRKALETRAKKGLLSETEKLRYATLQALAQKEGKNGDDASCIIG
ncbi:hypothetical protein JCM3774_001463 [Rhodotorula dairenensis]